MSIFCIRCTIEILVLQKNEVHENPGFLLRPDSMTGNAELAVYPRIYKS